MTSEQVYKYVHERYNYYDTKAGKYCGDKYTDKVFKETAKRFKCTVGKINELYFQYNYPTTKRDEIIKEKQSREKDNLYYAAVLKNIFNASKSGENLYEDITGKKVKINIENYKNKSYDLNKNFVKFIENNKNNIFTAKQRDIKDIYTFEEDDTWSFTYLDLIVAE